MMASTLVFISVLMVITLLYFIALQTFQTPTQWMTQINIKCPVSASLSELIFEDALYVQAGLLFYLLGAYYGLLIDARYFKGTHRQINKTSIRKSLIRLCLSLVVILPFFVFPIAFISESNSVFLVFFFKFGLPSFVVSTVLFGLSKKAYERFNLVQEEEMQTEGSLLANDDQPQASIQKTKETYDINNTF